MWGVQPESKGEGQPQELRQALVDYMSVWRTAANIEQNKAGLLSEVNLAAQHALLHLKACRVEKREATHIECRTELIRSATELTVE